MRFLASCGQTGSDLEAKAQAVSADSLDRPVLRQPWIMDDGEPAGLTGNNSLPRGPTPFTGHS